MTQPTIPPPHKRYHSYFVTTYRNVFLYWLANLIILPTYITCFFVIFNEIDSLLPTLHGLIHQANNFDIIPFFTLADIITIFRILILGAVFTPLLSLFYTPRYLRLGFKGRRMVFIVSSILAVFILLQPLSTFSGSISFIPDIKYISSGAYSGLLSSIIPAKDVFFLIMWVWLALGIVYFILFNTIRIRLLLLTIICLTVILMPVIPPDLLPTIFSYIINLQFLTAQFIILLGIIYVISGAFRHQGRIYGRIFTELIILSGCILIIFLWASDVKHKLLIITITGLGLMFLAAGPRNFISRQIAHLRMITRPIRHDQLYSQSSPVIKSLHIFNLLISQWLPRYVSINNRKLIYTLALIVGGIAIPLLFGPHGEPLELMALGVASASVLVSIYTVIWLAYNSSRFIVTEFETKASNPELEAIAKLTTFALVDELQRISILLKLRQVENLSSSGEETNAYFVTSGFDQDFINEVQQSVNLDVPKAGKISLDSLFMLGLRLLARIHVKGQVQRRSNGSIQIWAELNYRNTQRAAVDLVILPENSYQEIDDIFIRPYAREMALKLFIELGQVSHLGSSWKTFAEFLNGLEATSRRNWWQAIDFYRLALQTEETRKGTFGIGHYHLGAALVYQGNWDEGLQHLRTAEIDGPTLPETHYMLAMVLLRKHWGELHEYPNKFKEIERHLKSALALRGDFPEAHHLLGEAYYRRGELEDRESSRPNKIENSPPNSEEDNKKRRKWTSYFQHYEKAAYHFSRALKGYDRERWRTQVNRNLYAEVQDDVDPLTRQRMTAAHQLGDALRVLGRFSLADSYYQDVMTAYPQNIRNLADLTKTYCLAGNWQRAEEFLWRVAFTHDTAYWNADINLHMGWALAGGIYDKRPFLDWLIRETYISSIERKAKKRIRSQLGEAIQYLDFALHQRPRYITYWRQTDWHKPFEQVYERLTRWHIRIPKARIYVPIPILGRLAPYISPVAGEFDKKLMGSAFDPKKPSLIHYKLWIYLRQDGLLDATLPCNDIQPSPQAATRNEPTPPPRNDIQRFFKYIEEGDTNVKKHETLQNFERIYRNLKCHRNKIKILITQGEKQKKFSGLRLTLQKLTLGMKLYEHWKQAREQFQGISEGEYNSKPNFPERWIVDVYAEIALLTARVLAESGAFEILYDVATTTSQNFSKWLDRWREHFGDDFTFSPRVFAFQRAALYGWKAYAAYQCTFDFLTNARIHAYSELENHLGEAGEELRSLIINTPPSNDQILDAIQKDLDVAREDISCVPLILFVQAKVYRSRQMYDHAIEEYERLLDLMEPYDPKRHVGANQFKDYSKAPTDQSRNWMYYMEKVSGREQFEGIVNSPQVHVEIADIYRDLGKSELRVKHLTEAIRHSPFNDVDVDNFLRLAEELNAMERYQEAEAVIEAVRLPSSQLHSIELSYTKRIAPDVMTCVINTRRMKYASAIRNCRQVARQITLQGVDSYKKAIDEEAGVIKDEDVEEKTRLGNLRKFFEEADKIFNDHNLNPDTKQAILEKIEEFLVKPVGNRNHIWPLLNRIDIRPDESMDKGIKEAFVYLDSTSIQTAIERTPYSLNSKEMIELLKQPYEVKILLDNPLLEKIMLSQILYFLSRQAGAGLSQLAEICNATAYSRTESGVEQNYADENAAWAVTIMHYLLRWADHGTPRRSAIGLKLAQFSDTYGWLYYRDKMIDPLSPGSHQRQPKPDYNQRLNRAEHFLKQGIRYDQRRAIIRYHLARLYLTRIELIWQATPDAIIETSAGGRAKEIDTYITEALRQWRAAKEADTFGRLHSRLAWLYTRINRYKKAWEKREHRGIAGDPEADPDDLFDEPD